jgi:hypothetical protein
MVDVPLGDCVICLGNEGPPYPVQKGCGCRGAAGLTHIECQVEVSMFAVLFLPHFNQGLL